MHGRAHDSKTNTSYFHSIKPLKGRSTTSRSVSPSKLPPPSMNNPFGGAPQQQQQQPAFSTGAFGASNNAGAVPPQAASFTFGSSQQAPSNPFTSLNQSQSFGGFGQSQQPSNAPTFSPAKLDFSFGAPASPAGSANTNGSAAAPFAFGMSSPAKPADAPSFGANPSSNSVNVFGGFSQSKPVTSMFGQSQAQPKDDGITDAEVKEIEDAGPRLAAAGKMKDLEKIIRESSEKYRVRRETNEEKADMCMCVWRNADMMQNGANLEGFTPRELPADAQRKLLNFVRNPNQSVSLSLQQMRGQYNIA